MTSQKSLKNNVNTNDFKRSLTGSLLFPTIAFLVLFFTFTTPVLSYVTSQEFLTAREHNEISLFITEKSSFNYMFELVPIGMIICGMLTAVKSFNYLLSKKQVNVYLSLGIKRNTMLVNRLASGVISLFVAVFVPMLIIYITNIVCFGISAHLTSVFFYIVSLLFVSGLFGYAVASTMIMASGNIFEVAVSAVSFTFIPLFAISMGMEWLFSYLKGYTTTSDYDKWVSLLNPWQIATNFGKDVIPDTNSYAEYGAFSYVEGVRPIHLLRLFERTTTPDKFKVPDAYKVDMGFMLPIILWFVVAFVLVGATFYLFNKRKAEHANSLGKFAMTRAVVCTIEFLAIAYVLTGMLSYELNYIPLFFIIVAVATIAFLIAQLILSRKVKTAFKSLSWCGALVGALAIFAITIGTGFFGTYNKIPDKADVKNVSVELELMEMYAHYIYPRDEYDNYVKATTDESKEAVLEIYELLKNEKVPNKRDDIISTVRLAITDNDDNVKYRAFDIYSEETYMKYIQAAYGSDFLDQVLKNYLIDEIAGNDHDDSGYLRTFQWAVTDTDMLEVMGGELDYVEDTDALCKALYEDLKDMTGEELLKNNNKPIALIVRSKPDEDYPGALHMRTEDKYFPISDNGYEDLSDAVNYKYYLLTNGIPVYADMTNTVKFLKDIGYDFNNETYEIKEILYSDSPLSYNDATSEYLTVNSAKFKGWGSYTNYVMEERAITFERTTWRLYDQWSVGYFIDEEITEYELLKESYKAAGHPLISVTDKSKIEKIMDKTVAGDYLLLGDSGRYVYVIYEEGMIVQYYLPEANVSVVK